jgi:hypothetical protein
MGADGGITIYDLDKLYNQFDEEAVDSFLGHCGGSPLYEQDLIGKRYLTMYRGDNLHVDDMYSMILHSYDSEKDIFIENWAYNSYTAQYLNKLSKEHRESFKQIVDYLENECRITYWELWT